MSRYVLLDEIGGSLRTPMPRPSLTRPVLKHLPGQHDQKTHGRGGNHGLDPSEQVARAKETGESMHLPYPYPAELETAWQQAEPDPMGRGADDLKIRAMAYAARVGLPIETDADEYVYASAIEVYGDAIIRRRMAARVQQQAWDDMTEAERTALVMRVREVRDTGTVCIAVPYDATHDILSDGRFMSQFEVGDSGGAYDPDMRAMQETAVFDHHPHVVPAARPIYGYVAPDGKVTANGVSQYGETRFVLKPDVATRTTMTVGDSLNTHATPVPMTGDVTARDISNSAARTFFGDSGQRLATAGISRFVDWDYFEAQIHGGVSLDDVLEVHLPPTSLSESRELRRQFGERGIRVVTYDPDDTF